MDRESARRRLEDARSAASTPHRLLDIDLALDKLDLGTYGACEICRQTIAVERLIAFPEARFCQVHEPALEIRST